MNGEVDPFVKPLSDPVVAGVGNEVREAMIVMLLLLPETRGRAIASLEAEVPAEAYPSLSAVKRS